MATATPAIPSIPATPCSDPPTANANAPDAVRVRRPLIVVEGMPGAGKTTAVTALAGEGFTVIGEYTDTAGTTIPINAHPAVNDDTAHQTNWLTKHQLTLHDRGSAALLLDRDWLSALAYAYSISGRDHGRLLRARTTWARQQLQVGALGIPTSYVVLHTTPQLSLQRRHGRTTAAHPWSTPAALSSLAEFYNDPARTIAPADPALGEQLNQAAWHHLHGTSIAATIRYLRDLAGPQ